MKTVPEPISAQHFSVGKAQVHFGLCGSQGDVMTVRSKDAQCDEYLDESYTLKWFCDGFTPTCQNCSRKRKNLVFSKRQGTAA